MQLCSLDAQECNSRALMLRTRERQAKLKQDLRIGVGIDARREQNRVIKAIAASKAHSIATDGLTD